MQTTFPAPVPLGLRKSFGYGDRLGLATPGHLAAHRKFDFAPVFAQQSIREMTRTDRTPEEVMQAAREALSAAGFSEPWGADADHLKTLDDVRRTSAAGFCFFTIDPSEFVQNQPTGCRRRRCLKRRKECLGMACSISWIGGNNTLGKPSKSLTALY